MEPKTIEVKGAREHNLKNVSLSLPRNKLICFTGVSGSGKSSFAFDTLYAEGRRRYIESLSAYARQFLGQLTKPDADQITGLSPSISIQQKTSGWNPRSTVGTITQIHDFLRVLFARVGKQHCPDCDKPIVAQTRDQIVRRILDLPDESRIAVIAPVIRGQKGEYRDLFEDMLKKGYARARVDGQIMALTDDPNLERNRKHNIEIVIDRLVIREKDRSRLADAVDQALTLGEGTLIVQPLDEMDAPDQPGRKRKKISRSPGDLLLSSKYACPECGRSFEPPSPQMFSFNSPVGMCHQCEGLGTRFDFDEDLLVPDPKKSFLNLAVAPMRTKIGKWRKHIYQGVAEHLGIDLKTPWKDLAKSARDALLYGTGNAHISFQWKTRRWSWKHGGEYEGVVAELREKYKKATSPMVRSYFEKFMRQSICSACHGGRYNPQASHVYLGRKTLVDIGRMSIGDCAEFFRSLKLDKIDAYIAADALKEITGRLRFLEDVGLHYLTLDRSAPTLSGGESQRIRLASQIGAGLVSVLYILDEPSIGLHPRDNDRLLDSLERLRDMGNTVIVVEHDEDTMRRADHIVDFGPGPGVRGGEVVAEGDMKTILHANRSITGKYLSQKEKIDIPQTRRPVTPPKGGEK
jgi:excinuclease ABC subunit A